MRYKNLLLNLIVLLTFTFNTKAQNQEFHPLNYHHNGTPQYGVKIKTNLPYANGSQMPTIIIEGYNYQNGQSIGLIINWYIYEGNFYSFGASSHGSYAPPIKLANEQGKVVIFLDSKKYFNRFQLRAFDQGFSISDPEWYENWTAIDEALTDVNPIDVPYKSKVESQPWTLNENNLTYNQGNIGIGTLTPTSNLEVANDSGGTLSISTNKANGSSDTPLLPTLEFLGYKNYKKATIFAKEQSHNTNKSDLVFSVNNGDLDENNEGSNLIEALRISSNGNIGIGTRNPGAGLHINHDDGILIQNKTGNFGFPGNIKMSDGIIPGSTASDDMLFSVAGGFLFKMDNNANGINQVQGFNVYDRNNKSVFSIEETNGNIGIGTTTNLEAKLNIQNEIDTYGAILASSTEDFKLFTRTFDTTPNSEVFRIGMKYNTNFSGNGFISFYRGNDADNGSLGFSTNGEERMKINEFGNIAIGSIISDKYKLAVGGIITAEEIIVQPRDLEGNWPDFVFSTTYVLPTLQEVEKYIKKEGHLFDIPSTKEVSLEGIKLAEMNIKLLQKIEELTLYTIAQEKETQALKNEIKNLKTQNNSALSKLVNELTAIKAQIELLKK